MERIKAFFIEAIKTDAALAEAYDEKKLPDCWKYITKQAQKQAKNGCAMIEGAEVFKWARDFMYGDIEPEEKKPEQKPETKEEPKQKEIKTVTDQYGFEVYGEEPETTEEPVIELPDTDIVSKTFAEVENDKRNCGACGYFSGSDQYPTGGCLYSHKAVEKTGICPEFIGTPIKTKETKSEKKSKKKEDTYDGPSLFDFDDLM